MEIDKSNEIKEAMANIYTQVCLKSIRKTDKINIIGVRNVSEAMKLI